MQIQQIEGFRLSPQQKHLWLLQQKNSNTPYRVQCGVLITGNLQFNVLKKALQNVVNQYEILRTTFINLPGMEIPLQVIVDNYEISLNELNYINLSGVEQKNKIESLFAELKTIPFHVENIPPIQAYLVTLSPEKYILILTLSALIADRATLKYLLKIISSAYSACLQGLDISHEPMQYADIAEWQNELLEASESEVGKEYWGQQDINCLDNLHLWFENKQIQNLIFNPDSIACNFDAQLVQQLKLLAQAYNVNYSDVLLTCWLILISKITKNSNIFIGVAGDSRKYEELEQAVGLLSKYLPITCNLEANFKFSEILKQVNTTVNSAYEWQEYFTWEATEQSDYFCPFSFEFAESLEKYSVADVSFSIYQEYACIDKFKLKLNCLDTSDTLITEFYFDANLYNVQDIKTLSEQFKTLLENAISNPEVTISQLNILSDRQLQKLLVEFNNTNVNYSQDKCIHQIFEEQVSRTPDAIALVFEQQQLTYAQLNIRANQLAHHLRQQGVGPEVLVGLYVERSPEMVMGLLGILKAGGAYIPLDPAYPQQRLAGMLEDAQVKVLLTQKSLISNLNQYPAEVICLDADWEKIAQQSQENPHTDVKPENLVYVIFTSGSTGKPKGVAVEHRQLCNYLYAILEKLDFSTCKSFAHVATFAADLGNTIIYPALCIGGCLHLVSQERVSHPEALAEYFHHHTIDCLKIVPTHLAALLTSSQPEKLLPRKRLILGGEACSWQLIEQIQQLAPDCQIFNHYGPTETTVGVLTYPIKPGQRQNDSTTVPIGRAIANIQIYLLDSHQKPVPLGMSGELYIGGHNLARGYLHQPELTQEKFIPHPFVPDARLYKTGDLARYLPDGNIEFLGRIDHQVKIRGFRIELEEISRILEQHPQVQQTVITVREDVPGDKRLVAYIICDTKSQTNPTSADLRFFLQEKLPEYMIPSAFVILKTLPLTANGKLDREKLPAPELAENFVAPRTHHEKLIAGIWEEILNLQKVGIHNNFFELGGHSLLATQVISRLQQTFGVTITLRQLFEFPTVSELAVIITQQLAEQADEDMLSQMLTELEELSEEEVQATLAQEGASK